MFIKALGDHTMALVHKAQSKDSLWIRIDGPYGGFSLSYERYPVNVLVCGGVGATPMISLLRTVYDIGVTGNKVCGVWVCAAVMCESVRFGFVNISDCLCTAGKGSQPQACVPHMVVPERGGLLVVRRDRGGVRAEGGARDVSKVLACGIHHAGIAGDAITPRGRTRASRGTPAAGTGKWGYSDPSDCDRVICNAFLRV